MISKLIENYVNKMTISDVNNFALSNNINLNNTELDIVYNTIKKNWYTLIYGDYTSIFNNVKDKFDTDTYKKIEELFFYFKNKYQKFL
mgnify:CR=1 FL=1